MNTQNENSLHIDVSYIDVEQQSSNVDVAENNMPLFTAIIDYVTNAPNVTITIEAFDVTEHAYLNAAHAYAMHAQAIADAIDAEFE